jgi:bacillithiol system protein YtxJ
MKKLMTFDEFQKISESTFFVLKNSTTCPISQAAYEEYESFAEDEVSQTFYYLNVQDARELSNALADHFQVKHESPQVLLIDEGKVVWHDSHWAITYSKLEEVTKQYT